MKFLRALAVFSIMAVMATPALAQEEQAPADDSAGWQTEEVVPEVASGSPLKRYSAEFGAGWAGVNGGGSLALHLAGEMYFKFFEGDPILTVGLRPEFSYFHFDEFNDGAHEFQIGANVGAYLTNLEDLPYPFNSRQYVPYVYVGGGWDRLDSTVGSGSGADSGGYFSFAAGAKIFAMVNLYVAPQFTYIRGFGPVESNTYRLSLAGGMTF